MRNSMRKSKFYYLGKWMENKIKNLTFFVKKLLTRVKTHVIVYLTINIKNLFFIVHFLARVMK